MDEREPQDEEPVVASPTRLIALGLAETDAARTPEGTCLRRYRTCRTEGSSAAHNTRIEAGFNMVRRTRRQLQIRCSIEAP